MPRYVGLPATTPPAAPTVNIDATTVLKTGADSDGNDWHGRAVVIRRPSDGAVLMMYRSATSHTANDAKMHLRFTDDNGATWTADDTKLAGGAVTGFPMVPSGAGNNINIGDGLLYVTPGGRLICHIWSIAGTYPAITLRGTQESFSTDGLGEVWTAPVQIAFQDYPAIPDDQVFASDQSFNVGTDMYTAARLYNHGTDGIPSVETLLKSTDDGNTWRYISSIMNSLENASGGQGGGQEVGITRIGTNTIIAMLRDNPQTKSFRKFSTDLGQTWGVLTDMTASMGIAARQRVYTVAQLKGEANWWLDPHLIMVGFDHTTPGSSLGRRNAIWISQDSGSTWTAPFYMNTVTDDGGYGDIFWATGNTYRFVTNAGTLNASDLIQYDVTITV